MKIFLSYRRDDTGGRAGRLFDLLVTRFGAGDVFQDVTAIAPGLDFTVQVDTAIESSDVVLVVIGPNWPGAAPGGARRIDQPDDPVREEVRRALASTIPVVPVLVDGASLPAADELPDDVAPLALRQSVTLRDISWHEDVEHLVRRLEGDHRLATGQRHRWPMVLAGAALVTVLAGGVVVVVRRDGDGSSAQPVPPCEVDESWTTIDAAGEGPHVVETQDARVEFDVLGGAWRSSAGQAGGDVVVQVSATNVDGIASDDGSTYIDESWIDGLLVDRVVQSEVSCWGPVTGDPSLEPDEKVIVTFGFESQIAPAGATIGLELDDLSVLPVTPTG